MELGILKVNFPTLRESAPLMKEPIAFYAGSSPKGTSLANVTTEQLDYVVSLLNNRPRKRLGWKIPAEGFISITI